MFIEERVKRYIATSKSRYDVAENIKFVNQRQRLCITECLTTKLGLKPEHEEELKLVTEIIHRYVRDLTFKPNVYVH